MGDGSAHVLHESQAVGSVPSLVVDVFNNAKRFREYVVATDKEEYLHALDEMSIIRVVVGKL